TLPALTPVPVSCGLHSLLYTLAAALPLSSLVCISSPPSVSSASPTFTPASQHSPTPSLFAPPLALLPPAHSLYPLLICRRFR
ncbi:hypothetical protein NDU88_000236, partial [Pleurodeles waltl]